ncbi:FadR/GntR family transcriptional regulator [Streptomyces sp. H27-D2]|uniref:FadR/GntR family transcriptional regulator n=1 Tax=Streptomyces sp. H27-D2 TaxID=3046304 RepID=UPI002DBE708E|nr:GntR family transcriptional regulator [Streptomyces sp. H27-D2]MEC4015685.1 GntR family transcriptional regulator [Streptomyces sp. H27-D2]
MTHRDESANGSKRPHDHVAAALRGRIASGALPAGGQLPTQAALEAEFGVPRGVVRQAIDVLKAEDLVTGGRGAPPTVVRPTRRAANGKARSAARGLDSGEGEIGDLITYAFESDSVSIDCFTLTAESLNMALSQQQAHMEGRPPIDSLRLRVLLPGPDTQLALPKSVDNPDDERPRDRLRGITQNVAELLLNTAQQFEGRGFIRRVDLRIKAVPMTPQLKLYLVNGVRAFTAPYIAQRNRVLIEDGIWVDIVDVLGIGVTLEEQKVDTYQQWFDSLWEELAEEYPLTGPETPVRPDTTARSGAAPSPK